MIRIIQKFIIEAIFMKVVVGEVCEFYFWSLLFLDKIFVDAGHFWLWKVKYSNTLVSFEGKWKYLLWLLDKINNDYSIMQNQYFLRSDHHHFYPGLLQWVIVIDLEKVLLKNNSSVMINVQHCDIFICNSILLCPPLDGEIALSLYFFWNSAF